MAYSKMTALLACGLLGLGGCASETAGQDGASAIAAIVDRPLTLVGGSGSATIHSNGTISGEIDGRVLDLTWSEENGLICREGTFGAAPLPYACQTVRIENGQVSFINSDGTVSSTYSIG